MNRFASALAAAVLVLASITPVAAQDYPRGAINLVIPLAPGDATDVAGRAIADELAREIKVPVVVLNRPGAGGALGTSIVAKSKNDGYTLVLTNNASLIIRALLDPATATYDPFKDLTPLALAMRSPSVVAVRTEAGPRNFNDMVALAKKDPGGFRIGTAGIGSVGDFCLRTINSLTGSGITMVPYTGATPAVAALRGGHIEGMVLALGTMAAHLRSGVMRGIVISTKYPDFPDIPTLADLGYKQRMFDVWTGFFAPANVPAEVTNMLVPALERAIRSPVVAARLQPLGIIPDYSGPEKLVAEIRDEHKRVDSMAREAGLIK